MTRTNMVARNVLVSVANQLLTWVLSFWVTVMLPQHLGDVGFGQFCLAFAIAGLCGIVITLGTSTVLVREVARDHGRVSDLLPAALAVRLPLTLAAIGIALAASEILHYSREVTLLIVIAEAATGLGTFNDAFGSVLQGLEQLPKQNLPIFLERLIYSVGTIILLLMNQPIWTLIAISLLSNVCSLLINIILVRPYVGSVKLPTIRSMAELLKEGLPFAASSVFSSLYSQCDSPILEKLGAISMVGWYNLGRRLIGAALFFPVALTSALLPTLARMSREDPDAFAPLVRRMINMVLIAVVPFAVLLLFGSRQILVILRYSPDFAGSVPVLAVFGAGFVAWYLSQVVGTSLIASDKQKALSRITGIAALISAPLCIALVTLWQSQWHNGAIGAAVSDVAVETFLLTCYLRASSYSLMGVGSLWTVLKAVAASLPLVLLLHATGESHKTSLIVLYGAAGALAYLPLCLLFRCVQAEDMSMIRSALARRRAGTAAFTAEP
ncbi:MAG: flippase [Capsulimonadaceae bacterium]|nr:flippase [Capsulimonadaceae bacterium]